MKGEKSNTRVVDNAEFLFFSRNAFNKILKLVLEVVTKRMESFDARWDLKSIFVQIIYSMLFTSKRCSSFLNKLLLNKIDVFTILTFIEADNIKIVLKWRRGNAYSICNSIIEKYLQLSQTNFPWKSLEFFVINCTSHFRVTWARREVIFYPFEWQTPWRRRFVIVR